MCVRCVCFFVCVFFLSRLTRLQGFRLWRQSREGNDLSPWHIREGRLFLFGTLLMVIPFTARVVMFSWRFASSIRLPDAVFYTFAYAIPELLPLVIQLYVTRERKKVVTEGQAFIDNLYAASSNSDHLASFLLQSGAADSSAVDQSSHASGIQGETDAGVVIAGISPIPVGSRDDGGIDGRIVGIKHASLDGDGTGSDFE